MKEKIRLIAQFFGKPRVLLQAAEEFSEAATAILHLHRALERQQLDAPECYRELVDELADTRIMDAQLCEHFEGLNVDVTKRMTTKLNRTLNRYKIPDSPRWKEPEEID